MIEVVQLGDVFSWVMLGGNGNIIVKTHETFPCRDSAAASARQYRATFWALSDVVDERQARNI